MTMRRQPQSELQARKAGGVTGKGFVGGDSRINRTIPGPGRPPNWWRDLLKTYEEDAVHLIGATVRQAGRRKKVRAVDIQAAKEVLDRRTARDKRDIQKREVE